MVSQEKRMRTLKMVVNLERRHVGEEAYFLASCRCVQRRQGIHEMLRRHEIN
ncbi:hypothetical protein IHE45_10G020300 [Dioscorea alata]|uniref:Uncharacterized protein n=1 Tax=Dioscorea alata TaxID=55571 RepID=A0ACB7V9M1_DIOAL|nr:hypothetical protein IHE45_10G020300 [Dioscorea alata]